MTTTRPRRPRKHRRFAIVGGRLEDDNRQVYREMRRLCGGRILVFPTASSEPLEVGQETLEAFERHGFTAEVIPLTEDNAPMMARDESIIEKIAEVGSVYFTGGDQSKILNALKPGGVDTPVLKAIRKAHDEGGLLAGSSAGAAMMSLPMIVGGTSYEAMFNGVTDNPDEEGLLLGEGLGFFGQGLVDQHVIKRGRLARMIVALAHTGVRRAFGVDENTAMIIDGPNGQVVGEYGVFFLDSRGADFDTEARRFDNVRLSYLDDGDRFTFPGFALQPSERKRRVKKTEIAYKAPARSQRNAFGAYAVYDLIARLVLGDKETYRTDTLSVVDPRTKLMASATIERKQGLSRCLIATPPEGLRITALNLLVSLKVEEATQAIMETREQRGVRTFGMDLNERSRIVLLGSSPLYAERSDQHEMVALMGGGPVGILAAASAEARRTAQEHVDFFEAHNIEAVDLGVTIDNVDYLERDQDALDRITDMKAIFLCGGNQIRLVETLLHRGEESAVLRAMARAYANGATLIAASGAVSALSRLMIAGGTSHEAMRYGVASDLGHPGLAIHEGIGLLAAGIADQNLLSGRRLGRLVIACAEEGETFGIGVCDESAVLATKSSRELTGAGRHGFVLIDTSKSDMRSGRDGFVARGVSIRMFGPGDRINLTTGHVERIAPAQHAAETFERLTSQILREGVDVTAMEQAGMRISPRHAITMKLTMDDPLSATLDLACARDEYDG